MLKRRFLRMDRICSVSKVRRYCMKEQESVLFLECCKDFLTVKHLADAALHQYPASKETEEK